MTTVEHALLDVIEPVADFVDTIRKRLVQRANQAGEKIDGIAEHRAFEHGMTQPVGGLQRLRAHRDHAVFIDVKAQRARRPAHGLSVRIGVRRVRDALQIRDHAVHERRPHVHARPLVLAVEKFAGDVRHRGHAGEPTFDGVVVCAQMQPRGTFAHNLATRFVPGQPQRLRARKPERADETRRCRRVLYCVPGDTAGFPAGC